MKQIKEGFSPFEEKLMSTTTILILNTVQMSNSHIHAIICRDFDKVSFNIICRELHM